MLKGLLSLFLKSNCPLCDRASSEILCSSCTQQLQRERLKNPQHGWKGDIPLFAWAKYGERIKRAIAAAKYDNSPQLAECLGLYLGKAWVDSPLSTQFKNTPVVPIPLHPKKLKERGFNQAESIARGFCQYTRLPLKSNLLERRKETVAMFGLGIDDRAKNVADAFCVRGRLPHVPILLIDDIYTTGATVQSATQTLCQNGVKVVGVVAVATTRKGVMDSTNSDRQKS
ncbi:ComF family protein [Lusitaniella coriacea LEGE 07157]|uniref:ComF family protein n=2 Tax=Lusitaniella TaxID=1983104 RepID=A0A8J7E0I9_9CYAN|nr:ComF family protein [Lusitaniella coriacea LEGE 07157]